MEPLSLLTLLLSACGVLLLLVVVLLLVKNRPDRALRRELQATAEKLAQSQTQSAELQGAALNARLDALTHQGEVQSEAALRQLAQLSRHLTDAQQQSAGELSRQLLQFETRLQTLERTNEQKLSDLRQTLERQLLQLQGQNDRRLAEIQQTVDEKLQGALNEKMQQVTAQLRQVYQGLGEMQTLAAGVGDLKKVLSNVKTRGILGEIQLGAILQEVLAPEQYDTNAAVVPGSRNRVEFAVKFPQEDGSFVYLPIDAKFPGDTYYHLQEAYESGQPEAVAKAARELSDRLKDCARDIHDKYIAPPYTTSFGILFLPFEGLYAEAVNRGMVEELQRSYQINLAGPSTMAALLNALQMGFRTLAIQQRSHEVWQVLGEVKTEFEKYTEVLAAAQKHLDQASSDLTRLMGTRTSALNRKLAAIELPQSAENSPAAHEKKPS